MYEYLPIEQVKPGDIVEAVHSTSSKSIEEKQLYIVHTDQVNLKESIVVTATRHKGYSHPINFFKLIKTKPGAKAKVGDTVIRIPKKSAFCYKEEHIVGKIQTVTRICTNTSVQLDNDHIWVNKEDFVVLCKPEQHNILPQKRQLAFYKKSKEPWTLDELKTICKYVGDDGRELKLHLQDYPNSTYFFANSTNLTKGTSFMCLSDTFTEKNKNFLNCKQVAYEDYLPITTTPNPCAEIPISEPGFILQSPKKEKSMKPTNRYKVFKKDGSIDYKGLIYQDNNLSFHDQRPFVQDLIRQEQERIKEIIELTDFDKLYSKFAKKFNLKTLGLIKKLQKHQKNLLSYKEANQLVQLDLTRLCLSYYVFEKAIKDTTSYQWIKDYLTLKNINNPKSVTLFVSNNIHIHLKDGELYFIENSTNSTYIIPVQYNAKTKQFHL